MESLRNITGVKSCTLVKLKKYWYSLKILKQKKS